MLCYNSEILGSVMIAILLPFFLTTSFPVDDNAPEQIPEYTYQVHVNLIGKNMTDPNTLHGLNVTCQMVCQAKCFSTLHCRSENLKELHYEQDLLRNTYKMKRNGDIENFVPNGIYINFDDKGIENLVVPKNFEQTWKLDAIRSIINLLSIGSDLSNKPDEVFQEMENFTLGECQTTFYVKHWPLNSQETKENHENFELISLPSLNKVPGEVIDIKKDRDLKNCKLRRNYLLGRYAFEGTQYSDAKVNMESSTGHITVTDRTFKSRSQNQATIVIPNHSNFQITENLSVILQKVTSTISEFPDVLNTTRTTIHTNS